MLSNVPANVSTARRMRLLRKLLVVVGALALCYYLLAYWIAPMMWKHYEHHPKMEDAPKFALTREGIPGDALNIALIGEQADVIHSMIIADWLPADPVTFKSSVKITASALFGKPYPTAPVSNLYLFGRVEDLAFEQPVAGNTRQRHHVRFWRSAELGKDGKPMWIGAATFDRSVGVSHLTGKITHHVAPDIDAERDKIIADLKGHQQLVTEYQVTGIGVTFRRRNGGGDSYSSDGELTVGVLTAGGAENPAVVQVKENPPAVQWKDRGWRFWRSLW
jgi:hypothetical protein